MPNVTCPNCGDPVRIRSADYGRGVDCPACDQRFVPEDPDGDDAPRPKRPRPKKARWPLILLGVLGGALVLSCLGCFGFFLWLGFKKQDYSGPWTDDTVQDDAGRPAVTAAFPVAPASVFPDDGGAGGDGSALAFNATDSDGSILDATFLVGYFDYPIGTADPLGRAYAGIRRTLGEEYVGNPLTGVPNPKTEAATTVAGYPAKQATWKKDDGEYVLQVVHVTDRPRGAKPRLIVVLAGGLNLKPADRDRFLQSVRIPKGK